MKTAEEWDNHVLADTTIPCECDRCKKTRQIQLDAMKEGMRRAAEISKRTSLNMATGNVIMGEGAHQSTLNILTAAEQLTEKDL